MLQHVAGQLAYAVLDRRERFSIVVQVERGGHLRHHVREIGSRSHLPQRQ
jgi:hypothetical protein